LLCAFPREEHQNHTDFPHILAFIYISATHLESERFVLLYKNSNHISLNFIAVECSKRALLCTLNVDADIFNAIVAARLPSNAHCFRSYTTVGDFYEHHADNNYVSDDYLKEMDHPNVPPHLLELRVGEVSVHAFAAINVTSMT
jgi:hypothetical protein